MQQKYLATNSTQTDFTTATPVLANGRRTDFALAESGHHAGKLVFTGSANWAVIPMAGYNGIRIWFFGAGADNATITAARIWGATATANGRLAAGNKLDPKSITALDLFSVGVAVPTLSAALGQGGTDPLATTDRLADTITWTTSTTATTPKGPQTQLETDLPIGNAAVYSPGGDVPGFLDIPCVGTPGSTYGVVIEFDVGTATSANCLYELY